MPDDKTESTQESESEGLSSIERLAIGSAFNGDEDQSAAPADETKPAETATKSDVDLTALNERLSKAEERAFAAEQRAQFTAGQLALLRQGQQPKVEAPKPYTIDKEAFAAALEKNPTEAIIEAIEKMAESKAREMAGQVEGRVDGRFGQLGQQNVRAQRFDADKNRVRTRYGDVADSPEFVAAADKAILEIVSLRTGKDASEITQNDLAPGDLFSAASAVYGDWAASGKLPKNGDTAERTQRPLREIIASVPKGEDFGNPGGRGAKNGAVSLRDIYSDKEIPAIKKIMGEFGITKDADWIAHIQAAAKDDESYAR